MPRADFSRFIPSIETLLNAHCYSALWQTVLTAILIKTHVVLYNLPLIRCDEKQEGDPHLYNSKNIVLSCLDRTLWKTKGPVYLCDRVLIIR